MTQVAGLLGLFVFMYIVIYAGVILNYVLSSLALHRIAKRRLIKHPWLAWIPVANTWIIGSIADDYDAKMGINRKWRVLLLTLMLVYFAMFLILFIVFFAIMFSFIMKCQYAEPSPHDIMGFILPLYIGIIVIAFFAMAVSACNYICMFKIFESTVPHKALKYFLLSLLVPFAYAICLFLSRNQGYSNIPANPYVQQMQYPQNNQY